MILYIENSNRLKKMHRSFTFFHRNRIDIDNFNNEYIFQILNLNFNLKNQCSSFNRVKFGGLRRGGKI